MRGTKFAFTVCITVLVVLFSNGVYFLLSTEKSRFEATPVPIGEDLAGNPSGQISGGLESNVYEQVPVNLLLLGLDKDETRCDVIMLLHFDLSSSELKILSIARDTRIIEDGSYRKINSLYSKGGEKSVAREITEITGLPVHYYITMDFEGFRKIIDTLGGVKFYVPFRMNYDDPTQNLHIHLRKGWQVLDGKKAEQLVRYRKGNYKGQGYTEGDIGRIKTQQDFVKELIRQKLNFKYISKADEIFGILKKYVKTNIALSDIVQYIGYVKKIDYNDIKTYVLPGESRMIGDVWYYVYDRSGTAKMIEENFRK